MALDDASVGVRRRILKAISPKAKYGKLIGKKVVMKAGIPSGAGDAAPVGTICWDSTNSNAYICTVATGTWVKINA